VNLFGQLEHGKLNTSGREGEVDADSRDSSFDSGNGDHSRNRSEKVRTFTRIDSDSSIEGAIRSGKFQQREVSEDESRRILKRETDAMDNNNNPVTRNDKDRAGSESSLMEIGEPPYTMSAEIFAAPLMTMNVARGADTASGASNNNINNTLPLPIPLPPIAARSPANQIIPAPIQARDRLLEALHKLKQVKYV